MFAFAIICISCLLFLFCHECNGQLTQCYNEFECVNSTIVVTSGSIDCYGLGSCAWSSIDNIGSSDDGRTTRCWGSRSCQNSPVFSGTVEYESDIRGYLGLAWSKYVDTDTLACFGEASCYKIENTTSNWLYCYGFRSCDGIHNNNGNDVRGYAPLSLQNSVLYNPSSVYLFGFFSGYNSTIYCQSGYNCNVYCYSNGCENLRLICNDGSSCTVNCNDTQGVTCPNGWNASSTYNDKNDYWIEDQSSNYQVLEMISNVFDDYILNNETSFYTKNKFSGECDEDDVATDDIICGEGYGCYNDDILSKNNVCCGGAYSCVGSGFTITEFDNVYCDATHGCYNRDITGKDSSLSNIYSRGRYGIASGSTSNFNFIMASGERSSQSSTINYGNYLACFGRYSCYGATIRGVANIYAGGQFSMYYSTIISDGIGELNVYLLAKSSEIDMDISCAVGDVCNIYCINNECDDDIGNIGCSSGTIGINCDINWFYSLPTSAPTKSPTLMPSWEPTNVPTVTTTTSVSTTAISATSTMTSPPTTRFTTTTSTTSTTSGVAHTDSNSTMTAILTTDRVRNNSFNEKNTTSMSSLKTTTFTTGITTTPNQVTKEEELYSTTDQRSDTSTEQNNTGMGNILM